MVSVVYSSTSSLSTTMSRRWWTRSHNMTWQR